MGSSRVSAAALRLCTEHSENAGLLARVLRRASPTALVLWVAFLGSFAAAMIVEVASRGSLFGMGTLSAYLGLLAVMPFGWWTAIEGMRRWLISR